MYRTLIILLVLIVLLLTSAVGRAQVNRRLAMDYLTRGTTELDAGNLDRALAHFERAIELDPNYGAAYFSHFTDYSKGIELNPRGFLGFYNPSFVRKQKGDLDGAVTDLSKAIEINSTDIDALYERGILRSARTDHAFGREAIRLKG